MHGRPVVSVLVLGVGYRYLAQGLRIELYRLCRCELHVAIHTMVKVLTDLLLLVFDDRVLQLALIPPPHEMLLLLVLVDNVTANLALGRIPVALHSVCGELLEQHLHPAVWALHPIVRSLVQHVLSLVLLTAEAVVFLGLVLYQLQRRALFFVSFGATEFAETS